MKTVRTTSSHLAADFGPTRRRSLATAALRSLAGSVATAVMMAAALLIVIEVGLVARGGQ